MMRSSKHQHATRRGLTILEVIISIGIFLGSATIIAQLLGTGTQAAVDGRLKSQVALLAESKMAELASGVVELSSSGSQSFDDVGDMEIDEAFTWSAEVEDGGQNDLLSVSVTVEHKNEQDEVDFAFTLTRLMRDPEIWLDAQISEEE